MCVNIWNFIVGTNSCEIFVKFICYFFLFVHCFKSIEIVSEVDFGGFLLRALSIVCQVFWPLPTCLVN